MLKKIHSKQRRQPGELRFGCPDAHPVPTRAAFATLCYLSNHGVCASAHASANPSSTRATSNDASSDQVRRSLRMESTKRWSDAPSATRWFRYRRKKRSLCCAILDYPRTCHRLRSSNVNLHVFRVRGFEHHETRQARNAVVESGLCRGDAQAEEEWAR